MAISNLPLGMNARNFTYIRKYNLKRSKRRADSKVHSKKIFIKYKIPTTKILKLFQTRNDVRNFDWNLPVSGFVIKPTRGYGGEGIIIIKSWDGENAITSSGVIYDKKMITTHLLDILEGIYSLQHLPDSVFLEERITPSPFLRKYSSSGLADVRIIVFRKIPVMAMMRIPTHESEGKANLHLGAIGLGIGLRTGITFNAIYKNKNIKYFPGTKLKTRGIKIPDWDKVLKISVMAQDVSGLGFCGIDIVFDKFKGPLVLEVNSRSGLSIQLVNKTSLRTRLERVENIDVPSIERGIEIAKNLFAENIHNSAEATSSVLSVIENVSFNVKGETKTIQAKLDTGAFRTSIDSAFLEKIGGKLLSEKVMVKSASGIGYRPTAKIYFKLKDRKISSIASVADRSELQYKMIIGRRDLKGSLINPELEYEEEDELIV